VKDSPKEFKPNSILNIEDVLLFYRHWIWADMLRTLHLKSEGRTKQDLLYKPRAVFMYMWYAMLYVLIEFMSKKRLVIATISDDIRDVREPLRLCRNAVFHVQSKFTSEKLTKIIREPGSRRKIQKIHSEIGKYGWEALRNEAKTMSHESRKMVSDITGIKEKILEGKKSFLDSVLRRS